MSRTPDSSISSTTSPEQALRVLLQRNFNQARSAEPGILLGSDIEHLHDYRVCLRRMRAALAIFQKTFNSNALELLKSGCSQWMRATGQLRDLDVALTRKHDFCRYVDKEAAQLSGFFDFLELSRKDAYELVEKHFKSDDYNQQAEAFSTLIESGPLVENGDGGILNCSSIVKRQVTVEFAKACKRADKISDRLSDRKLHALRIQCKKLRYALELFADVLHSKHRKAMVNKLKTLQDEMGAYNDSCMQLAMVKAYLSTSAQNKKERNTVKVLCKAISAWQADKRVAIVGQSDDFFNGHTYELIGHLTRL